MPDYALTRLVPLTAPDVDAFERLYTEAIAPGRGDRIAYNLAAPQWQFLCWLADRKKVLLHGSGVSGIEKFHPRRPADTSEFGGQLAVFAASDGLWAMFFALVNRQVATSLVNMSVFAADEAGPTSYYYFSVNEDSLVRGAWSAGTVYILPRDTFKREVEDDLWCGRRIESNQWASPIAVRPLASLAVQPSDFPFLDQVNGHHQPTVAARAAEDPNGFPWRD